MVLAHQFALASPMVQAEMIDASQFYELSVEYQVSGVPHTAINEGKGTVVGAVPEQHLIMEIQRVLGEK